MRTSWEPAACVTKRRKRTGARYGLPCILVDKYLYSLVQVFLLQCLVLVDGRLQLGLLTATNAQRPGARGCIDAQSHMQELCQCERG